MRTLEPARGFEARVFSGKRHYREMLYSEEHISTNILADRLKMLLDEGIVTKTGDPSHRQKAIYSLTEKGIALLPILTQISSWSLKYRPVGEAYAGNTTPYKADGDNYEADLMAELRKVHLGQPDSEPTK